MDNIQTIIQGGAVGLCAFTMWILYKVVTNHGKHLEKTVDRNTEAWINNTKALHESMDLQNKSNAAILKRAAKIDTHNVSTNKLLKKLVDRKK